MRPHAARVNAMRQWWSGGLSDPIEAAMHLAARPDDPRYGALHAVGETYRRRSASRSMIELPDQFRQANTLEMLADVVYQRPAIEFAGLNGGIDTRVALKDQAVVVPDAELAALFAARIAAELVVRDDLDVGVRRKAAQRLVPIAARHPTALDTVLSRLLLLDPAGSTAQLGALSAAVHPPASDSVASAQTDPLGFGPA